jgi:hypothetical protein
MGVFDGIIQLILFVCFGVYIVMGLTLTGMGIAYMSDAGAVGATGSWLIFFGLIMLIIGGIAVFANLKQIWLILFVIEIVNVFLFLGLYIAIIVVVMMASGTSDPIRRAAFESWETVKPTLTIKESDGSGGIYCETMVESGACKDWYTKTSTIAASAPKCSIGGEGGITVEAALNNCSRTADFDKCGVLKGDCLKCEEGCREQSIQDVKDEIIPASFFVLFLVVYFLIVIVWNNVMIGSDDLEGVSKIIGLVLNGILLLFALVLTIMGMVGYFSIECPKDASGAETDCRPTSLVFLILLGVATLGVSGVVVAGIQINNNLLLRVGTLVMVFVAIFLIMAGIIMGMSSGAVMDDMNYYYDTQYPKLRQALERADNTYCQMSQAECTDITLKGTKVTPKDKDGKAIEGAAQITRTDMWKMQYNEAALEASKDDAPKWMASCETTGICIYCKEFYTDVQTKVLLNKAGNVSLAPNIDFTVALFGYGCKNDKTGAIVEGKEQFSAGAVWQSKLTDNKFIGFCPTGSTPVAGNVTKVTGKDKDGNDVSVLQNYKAVTATSKMTSAAWQAIIGNHTRFAHNPKDGSENDAFKYVGKCSLAITNHVAMAKYCPEDAATKTDLLDALKVPPQLKLAIKDTYVGDCGACQEGASSSGMSFVTGGSTGKEDDLDLCLNYFVGHMQAECSAKGGANSLTCADMFDSSKDSKMTSPATAAKNIKYMVDKAYVAGSLSKFCSYPDKACKKKIQDQIENSMGTIAIFGVIFIIFFLAIIFFTLQGIYVYKGGGDDDDDDDGDDDE